jgi:VIT1/CCC1 family predicted Fe2+/Mn2+ transporter
VQDFDYLHHLKDVNKVLVEREYLDRARKFLSFLKAETFPRTRYKTFERRQATQPDLLLNWLRAHLWKKLSWSKEEKVARRHAYISGEDPQQFSLPTRLITSLTIAVGSAAFFVIPTVLMTLPETVSIAWSLTTMSLAILVFGACAALFMGPEPNTQDVVGATAAYAAVLVVFYGNIVNNLQSK